MKLLINPMFGKIRGMVGDLVFKQVNGKTIVCQRPHRSAKINDPAALDRQKRFALNCKLSKCINQIDEYKPFWHKAAIGKMSNYNAIQKPNYPHVQPDSIHKGICLTTDSIKMDFSEYGFCFDGEIISLEFKNDTLGVVKNYNVDNFVMFAGVIFLSNPKGYTTKEFKFFDVKSEAVKVMENEKTLLGIELDDSQIQVIESYNECVLYFGFISKDKEGNVINEVSTFTEDMKA